MPRKVLPAIGKYTANAAVADRRAATNTSANRARLGRASSTTRLVARIGDETKPPYAPDIPLSAFVALVLLSSCRRCETQVPRPPPSLPSASSGPRLAPP